MDSAVPPDLTPWKIRASRYVIDRPHLKLRSDTVELPDGTIVDEYYVRESRGYSVIFALTPQHQVVLVRQYKHGVGREILELPAGSIDLGELPEACAARELAEETGYIGEAPQEISSFSTDTSGSNGRFYLHFIRNAEQRVAQSFDITEQIAVELVSLDTLQRMVRDGTIDGNSHVAAVLFIFDQIAQGLLTL